MVRRNIPNGRATDMAPRSPGARLAPRINVFFG
jgi:hypothetical protein